MFPGLSERRIEPLTRKGVSENAVVERGVKALNDIHRMTARIPHLMKQSHLESSEGVSLALVSPRLRVTNAAGLAWSAYWLPVFQALTTQCTNPCREIRHLAFSSLQRSLLSPELTRSSSGEEDHQHSEWTAIFGEVLFPLILRLLKPEVFSSDRDGMSETRVQAASLLSKVFLQYLVVLSEWEGLLDLWVRIIEIMDRLMNSGQGDSLVRSPGDNKFEKWKEANMRVRVQEEAVPENLKNVLLIMSSNGYLVPPSKDPAREELWNETWKRIDRFLPSLRADLALEEEEPVKVEEPPKSAGVPPPAEAVEVEEEKPVEGGEGA